MPFRSRWKYFGNASDSSQKSGGLTVTAVAMHSIAAHPHVVLVQICGASSLLSRGQDHRHRLRVNLPDLGIRFRRQEREDVGRNFTFLRLPNARPIGPQTDEAKQGDGIRPERTRREFSCRLVSKPRCR
jgi:hypothetical protein